MIKIIFSFLRRFKKYAPPNSPTGIPAIGVIILLKTNTMTTNIKILNQLIVKFLNPHMIV